MTYRERVRRLRERMQLSPEGSAEDEAQRAADLLLRFYLPKSDEWHTLMPDLVAAVEAGGMNLGALKREARRRWKAIPMRNVEDLNMMPDHRGIDDDGVIEAVVTRTTTRAKLG